METAVYTRKEPYTYEKSRVLICALTTLAADFFVAEYTHDKCSVVHMKRAIYMRKEPYTYGKSHIFIHMTTAVLYI